MAVCIAVIGKDVSRAFLVNGIFFVYFIAIYILQNSPKYIKCADEANALQFHYKVHTSLDIVEEKLNLGNKNGGDVKELFLGLLYSTEEYKL